MFNWVNPVLTIQRSALSHSKLFNLRESWLESYKKWVVKVVLVVVYNLSDNIYQVLIIHVLVNTHHTDLLITEGC